MDERFISSSFYMLYWTHLLNLVSSLVVYCYSYCAHVEMYLRLDVRSRVATVVNFNHLPIAAAGSNPTGDLDLFM